MPGQDRSDAVDGPAHVLVEQLLADPGTRVTMGVTGALAEFARRPGEPMSRGGARVVTARGGVSLTLPAAVEVIAYETPTARDLHWSQAVSLCVDRNAARLAARPVVTALGPDVEALRPRDRTLERFDLGLAIPSLDVCVRTDDEILLDALHAACDGPLTAELAALLVDRSPDRVFSTVCGRIEVLTPIPQPGGASPDGPHTHLLPDRLRPHCSHPAAAPIPNGLVTCATLYPPHPVTEVSAVAVAFDTDRYAAFQKILSDFGDPVAGALKAMTLAAVRAGVGPDLTLLPRDAAARAAVVVTLRQIAHLDGPSDTLDVWRARHPPDAGLLHPDG